VIFELEGLSAAELAARAALAGARVAPIAPRRLRAVTHLDVDAAGIDSAIAAISGALDDLAAR